MAEPQAASEVEHWAEVTAGEQGEYPFNRRLILYRVFWAIAWVLFKAVAFFEVEGREHVPADGAVILAGTHRSYFDIPLLALAARRPVHFMGKAELWDRGLSRWFCRTTGGFPVRRGDRDRPALRTALRVLDEGRVMGIFPEGARRDGPSIESLRGGVAYLARKSGAPIVPAALYDTEKLLGGSRKFRPFTKVVVKFGEPIDTTELSHGYMGEKLVLERLQGALQDLYSELAARRAAPS